MRNSIQRFLSLTVMVLCLASLASAGNSVPLSNMVGKYKGELEDHGGMVKVTWTIKKKSSNSIIFTYGASRMRSVTLTVQSNKGGVVTCTGAAKDSYGSTILYILKYTDKAKTLRANFGYRDEEGDKFLSPAVTLTKVR